MRSVRLLAWYRAVPLFLILVFGLVSAAYSFAPSALLQALYPLRYEDAIASSSARHDVDPYLVCAVIEAESGWNPDAESHQGAQGLMQLMPETAFDMEQKGLVDQGAYSADNLGDPETNIEFGTAYLSYLLDYFNGSTERAIAAYNAGLSNVNNWVTKGGLLHNAITYPETQAYLVRVQNARSRYQELYADRFTIE